LHVIEFAAWIIVGKTAGELLLQERKSRRERVEREAVNAEYNDYTDDRTLSELQRERARERHTERQRKLLVRYPQYLIPGPDWRYFRQAEEEEKAAKGSFNQRLKENWKWWVLAVLMLFVGYLINLGLRATWAIFMDWISHSK